MIRAAQALGGGVAGTGISGIWRPPAEWRLETLGRDGSSGARNVLPWAQDRPGIFLLYGGYGWSERVLPRKTNRDSRGIRFIGSDAKSLRRKLHDEVFAVGQTHRSRIRQVAAAALDLRALLGAPFRLSDAGELYLNHWLLENLSLSFTHLDLDPVRMWRLEREIARRRGPTMDIHRPPPFAAPEWHRLLSRAVVAKSVEANAGAPADATVMAEPRPQQPRRHWTRDWGLALRVARSGAADGFHGSGSFDAGV